MENDSDADALPAESRLISRIDGDALVVEMRGRSGNWGLAAIAGFLGICFFMQGILVQSNDWLAAGIFFLFVAMYRTSRNLNRLEQTATVRVDPRAISINWKKGRRIFEKNQITSVQLGRFRRNSPCAMQIQMQDGKNAFLLEGQDEQELRWLIGQVKKKWDLA
ncbi:MAG: hypothetical protein ABSG31_11385 [Tepidisphaeraceae bacterium]